ncbi:MAG: hypothetical protein J6J93_08405 [Muribaculaceae bacterium]|nr:hypothetical protein [Muribaculaceae bacterium]
MGQEPPLSFEASCGACAASKGDSQGAEQCSPEGSKGGAAALYPGISSAFLGHASQKPIFCRRQYTFQTPKIPESPNLPMRVADTPEPLVARLMMSARTSIYS